MKKAVLSVKTFSLQAVALPIVVSLKWIALLLIGLFILASCKKEAEPGPQLPDTGEAVVLESTITEKTVLTDKIDNPDLPDYLVSQSVDVNAELTIQPGVVIAFERDTRLNVNSNGALIAQGTADKKIKLVGVQKTKGYWSGIMHYSGSSANILAYVEVMHAGSKPLYSTIKAGLFLSGASKAQIALKNTAFSQNDGYGVYVYEGGIFREFVQNAFTKNTESGLLVTADNVTKLDRSSIFTGGNGRNVVELGASSEINGTAEVVWAGFEDRSAYLINGDLGVNTGWKINPGVKVEMNRDAVIRVNTSGYLSAIGTSSDKVLITSAGNVSTFWKGIICYSTSNKNVIENSEISHAGSTTIVSNKKATIAVYGTGATLAVKSTVIKGSGGYGVFVGYGATANTDVKTANTFTSNSEADVFVE